MNTKKNVLFLGIVGSILLFLPAILNQILSCYQKNWFFCNDSYEIVAVSVFPLVPILIFSLITYRLKDEVFQAWWRFARWWVPVIIAVTLFLQNAGGGGGIGISGAVSGAFDALVIGILYIILVIVSLVKIVRTYLRTKETW